MPYHRFRSCDTTRSLVPAVPIAARATATVSSVLPSSTRTISQSDASSLRTAMLLPITLAMLGASLCAGMIRLSEPSSRLSSHHGFIKTVLNKRIMRSRPDAGDPIPSIRSQFTGVHQPHPDGPPQPHVAPGPPPRPARSLVIGLGLIGVAAGVAWLLGLGHAAWLWPGQSDSAAVILLGQDMINGNWALNGWLLPTDTYWLTEVPLYAVGVSIRGVVPSLIHDVPLLLYLGVIASGILVARAGRPGIRGWAGAALTFILLGMLGPSAAVTVLHGPAHISTALACLLAFAALRWVSARRPAGYVLASVLLVIALVSDPMARATGLAPILAAAAITGLRSRAWRRPGAQAATALGALPASQAVRVGVQMLGGYTVGGGAPDLV